MLYDLVSCPHRVTMDDGEGEDIREARVRRQREASDVIAQLLKAIIMKAITFVKPLLPVELMTVLFVIEVVQKLDALLVTANRARCRLGSFRVHNSGARTGTGATAWHRPDG
jgi:hypothetical protein